MTLATEAEPGAFWSAQPAVSMAAKQCSPRHGDEPAQSLGPEKPTATGELELARGQKTFSARSLDRLQSDWKRFSFAFASISGTHRTGAMGTRSRAPGIAGISVKRDLL